jgi:hypothetical protein
MSSDFERFLESLKPPDARDPAERAEATKKASEPILRDLVKAGYDVTSIGDIRHLGKSWERALPILLHWLPLTKNGIVKEEIVRCLSVPWIRREATPQLLKEFKSSGPNESLAWAIGNALSIVDVSGFEKEIIELVRDHNFGMARQMLVIALGKIGGSEAEDAALSSLQDKDLVLHAIDALGAMRSARSVSPLKELLHHDRSAVRKAAKKALQRLQKV